MRNRTPPVAILVRQLEEATEKGGIDTGLILRMAEHFRNLPAATAEARELTAPLLNLLLGTGLYLRPETALEPVRNRIMKVARRPAARSPEHCGPLREGPRTR